MHFVSSLAWEELGLQFVEIPFSTRWHGIGLINTCWAAFCVLAGIGGILLTQVEIHFESLLSLDEFSWQILRTILCTGWHRWVWSTHVEMHFVSSLGWEGFAQHMFRCIFCPSGTGCLFYTCWDTLNVLADMGWVGLSCVEKHFVYSLLWMGCTTQLETHFVSSLAWDGLVITGWNPFCFFTWMEWFWSTQVEISFLFSLAWDGIVNIC